MSSQVILFACSKCFSRHPFEELSPGQQLCKVRHPFYFLSFIYEIASQLDYVRAMLRQLNRNAMNQIDRMRAVSFVAFSMVMRPKMNLHHSLHDYVTTRHTLGHIVFFFFLSGLSLFILSLLCYSNSENAQCAMLFSPSTMIQMRFINKPERRETFQTFCICRRVSHSEPICRDTERPTDRLPSFALLNCVHTIKFVCLPLTLTYFRQLIFFKYFSLRHNFPRVATCIHISQCLQLANRYKVSYAKLNEDRLMFILNSPKHEQIHDFIGHSANSNVVR